MSNDVYVLNGYRDRKDYLESMAEEYGVSDEKVALLADILGPDEDFDGLVSTLEDLSDEL